MASNIPEKSEDGEGQASSESQLQISTVDQPTKHEFPEGGTRGWLVVLGCFCVMFITFGYVNAFGYVPSNSRKRK
jgi:hypothetical protein